MAEEQSAEKTEEPTPKRREKFREEGNVATSADVGGAAILATALLVVAIGGGTIYRGSAGAFTERFALAGRVRVDLRQELRVLDVARAARGRGARRLK